MRAGFHNNGRSAVSLLGSQGGSGALETWHKVKVEGARRLWGTLSICSASTVENVNMCK